VITRTIRVCMGRSTDRDTVCKRTVSWIETRCLCRQPEAYLTLPTEISRALRMAYFVLVQI